LEGRNNFAKKVQKSKKFQRFQRRGSQLPNKLPGLTEQREEERKGRGGKTGGGKGKERDECRGTKV
jgi:hypothetical protein